jgi:GTP cyclohydrolase II
MPHRLALSANETSPARSSLLAVNRAVSDLRRGGIIVLRGGDKTTLLVMAAEAATPAGLDRLRDLGGDEPFLVITGRRAVILGIGDREEEVVVARPEGGLTAWLSADVADPLSDPSKVSGHRWHAEPVARRSCASAAIGLAKVARMLPAAVAVPLSDPRAAAYPVAWAEANAMLVVEATDIFHYESNAARSLRRVSEARVPLEQAEHTRIVTFRPGDGGTEHLAIIIGEPDAEQPVLVRLHSECFTGDLLGSLRCDCGDQLRGAIAEIAKAGSGVLLYLAQEGRGIGLVNKLRAYELQDRGLDTIDANEQLGFDADERVYLPAAEMLRQLGYARVRLLTNNPEKVEALGRCGIRVEERVPHAFPANRHNELYLFTKATRSGHLF